ncbi:MAG: YceD family protein [Cellvibrionales bacterium]|jgi:uncharacterized protein
MTPGGIPHHVDLRTLAVKEVLLQGGVEARHLPRLTALVRAVVGSVGVNAQFFRDEENRYAVKLETTATVRLVCQRCLEDLETSVGSETLIAAVWDDEQAAQLPARYEPVIAGSEVDFWEVVEDELLLSMPTFPYHSEPDCELKAGGETVPATGEGTAEELTGEGSKPFAALAALKGQLNQPEP